MSAAAAVGTKREMLRAAMVIERYASEIEDSESLDGK